MAIAMQICPPINITGGVPTTKTVVTIAPSRAPAPQAPGIQLTIAPEICSAS